MRKRKQHKDLELYKCAYPNYIAWSKALWIVDKGDMILEDNIPKRITKRILDPIAGAIPKLELEEINIGNDSSP